MQSVSPLESRTRTFAKVPDYQKEIESESGYIYTVQQDGDKFCRVTCTPQSISEGEIPIQIDYSAVLHPIKGEILIHTAVRAWVKDGVFANWSETFSFKNSVTMNDLSMWVNKSREKASSEGRYAKLPEKPLSVASSHKVKLIWPLIRLGVKIQHEKKSKAKDIKDDELFDTDRM